MTFGYGADIRIGGATAWASRSGYTGEDGVELIVGASDAEEIASILLADERVQLAGLAAVTRYGWKPGFASTGTN